MRNSGEAESFLYYVMTTASTSAWVWDSRYSLYYNATTRQWAAPQPDGSWKYSECGASSTTGSHAAGQSGTLEEGQLDDEDDESYTREEQTWPVVDVDDRERQVERLVASAPILRLVVASAEPSVLARAELKIAVLDPSEPVSIGRDRSYERRIRLRELAVSKDHATVFFDDDEDDEQRRGWSVIDNGSTHGTFVVRKGQEARGEIRISPPKVASSSPFRLGHLDTVRCGTTRFTVHVHASFACSTCTVASDGSNVIPLIDKAAASTTTPAAAYHTKTKEEKEVDRRRQLKGLKDKYLNPTTTTTTTRSALAAAAGSSRTRKDASILSPSSSSMATTSTSAPSTTTQKKNATLALAASPTFFDRAAARRARDASATKAMHHARVGGSFPSTPRPPPLPPPPPPPPFDHHPRVALAAGPAPDPFSHDSKGAQMLSKMTPAARNAEGEEGGRPREGAPGGGGGGGGLGTLIEARTFDRGPLDANARPGLGSRPLIAIDQVAQQQRRDETTMAAKRDWRQDVREASRKRFKEMD
ncbi:hypothetical protein JCM3766R1_002299 [Sporobolomyces carnicolor]